MAIGPLRTIHLALTLLQFLGHQVTFPRFRVHSVKPQSASLRIRPESHSQGSINGASDYRTPQCTRRCPGRVFTSRVVPMVNELTLERSEETFYTGVVTAAPSLRHVGGNAVSGEQQLVPHGGILAAET